MQDTPEDSVFTKIIRGEIPCHKVYEDEKNICILPLNPIAKGHVLVIPKLQVDHFQDLPDEDYQSLMAAVKKVAQRMKQVLGTRRVGLKIEGLGVPHAHVHVIAFDTAEEYNEPIVDDGNPDHEALARLAQTLAF